MSKLTKHGSLTSNLPEEPLIDIILSLRVSRQEFTSLLSEIEEDGSTFEDGNRFAVGAVGVDQGRNLIVGLVNYKNR